MRGPLIVVVLQLLFVSTTAFLSDGGRGGGGGGGRPPRSWRHYGSFSEYSDDFSSFSSSITISVYQKSSVTEEDEEMGGKDVEDCKVPRGGSQQQQQQQQPATDVVKGTQATLSATASFWGSTFGRVAQGIKNRVVSVRNGIAKRFQSPEQQKEQELLQQLETMPVQRVVVKDTQVLPTEVVQIATRRSGLLGKPLQAERVQELARTLKQWYDRQGYVLHSVTGATLEINTATAEIQVQEPVSASQPVNIVFCREMVVDSETGELLSMRQYKDRNEVKRKFGTLRKNNDKAQQLQLQQSANTTLIETNGRTNPSRIAHALGLRPNRPFKWQPHRWQNIVQSGVFSRVVRATPQTLSDGTVQLNIIAQEAPTRHLEYGVGKSLYTGTWEGELDFEHGNLFGGGEVVGLSVRRGTKDAEPSVNLCFTDDRFGLEGGYTVEAFSDFIGDTSEEQPGEMTMQVADTTGEGGESEASSPSPHMASVDYDQDALLTRRGATFRLRNPFNPEIIRNSQVSASLERTSTRTGLHEKIGSATLQLGPFRRALPWDAISSVETSLTTGTRVLDSKLEEGDTARKSGNSFDFKPYASFTATTKQIIPVVETRTKGNRVLTLALCHSATLSSSHLPRHEARARGVSNDIRGAKSNGRVASALRGTTELRIPVDIPIFPSNQQDAKVVLFGDWLFATKDSRSAIYRKSSCGIGLRKSIQGFPVHCNLCYAGDGKIKTLFGLGRDFEA